MKIIQPSIEILTPIDGDYILKFLEQCGRTCYKSEDKITADSAKRFVRNLIKRGHESVIEHFSVTVKVICNRGISHEIVRHRIGAYSQESTRYVNYRDGIEVIEQPAIEGHSQPDDVWIMAMEYAEKCYKLLIQDYGVKPEIARDVLPNALKTEIVITYNLRQWRHFFRQRLSKAAHPQIRQIAGMILKEFKERIPVIFEDIGGEENAG
jgi:thymidylate synthase (FAD)